MRLQAICVPSGSGSRPNHLIFVSTQVAGTLQRRVPVLTISICAIYLMRAHDVVHQLLLQVDVRLRAQVAAALALCPLGVLVVEYAPVQDARISVRMIVLRKWQWDLGAMACALVYAIPASLLG